MSINQTTQQPTVCATAFGRVFLAAGDIIYFSRVIESIGDIGKCYQINDPVNSDVSDLLADDGGVVVIDEARELVALVQYRSGILAFGRNGVWYLSGTAGSVLSATSYQVTKVTTFGCLHRHSIIVSGEVVMYFSSQGVIQLTANDYDVVQASLFIEQTIKSFYINNFTNSSDVVTATYDETTNNAWWLNGRTGVGLIFDGNTSGWYPQNLVLPTTTYIGTAPQLIRRIGNYQIEVINIADNGTSMNVGRFVDTSFHDYGVPTEAYLVTVPESLGMITKKKSAVYLHMRFLRTETSIIGYDDDDDYIYDLPSSCTVVATMDSSTYKEKTTKPREFYRLNRRGFLPEGALPHSLTAQGDDIVAVSDKIRGWGDTISFKFQPASDKDCQILGYTIDWAVKGKSR